MAHEWDPYLHNLPPVSSDPRTLARTLDCETYTETFTEHQDFTDQVVSHQVSSPNTNYCSDPGYGNSNSDCLYQKYFGETPWQGHREEVEKPYVPCSGNGNLMEFTNDASKPFPSSFSADFKQDCEMPATSFLEDYSDISNGSDAGFSEAKPSCNLTASNLIPKSEADVGPKQHSPDWLFSNTGNVFPTDSLSATMSESNANMPLTVEAKDSLPKSSQDKVGSMEENESCAVSSSGSTVPAIGSEAAENNSVEECQDQNQGHNIGPELTEGKHPDVLERYHDNMTSDEMADCSGNAQEVTTTTTCTTCDDKSGHYHENATAQKINDSFNKEKEENDTSDKHKAPIPKSQDGCDENIQADGQGRPERESPESASDKVSDSKDRSCVPSTNTSSLMRSSPNDEFVHVDKQPSFENKVQENFCVSPLLLNDGDTNDTSDMNEQCAPHHGEASSSKDKNMQSESHASSATGGTNPFYVDSNVPSNTACVTQCDDSALADVKGVSESHLNSSHILKNDQIKQSPSQSPLAGHPQSLNKNEENADSPIQTPLHFHPQNPNNDTDKNANTPPVLDQQTPDQSLVASQTQNLHENTDEHTNAPSLNQKCPTSTQQQQTIRGMTDGNGPSSPHQRPLDTSPVDTQPQSLSTYTGESKDVQSSPDHQQPPHESPMDLQLQSPCDSSEENVNGPPSSDQQQPQEQRSPAFQPQMLSGTCENVKESIEEFNTSTEEQNVLAIVGGEPFPKEDPSGFANKAKLGNDERPMDTSDRNRTDLSEKQIPQLKSSEQMRRRLQPVVILEPLGSSNKVTTQYQCGSCKHIANDADDLIEHQSSCHIVNSFQFCKTRNLYLVRKVEAEKLSFNTSLGKKRNRVIHKCKRCNIVFPRVHKFIRHMRAHTGKTPFQCTGCGQYFSQSTHLRRHIQVPGRCKKGKYLSNVSISENISETPQQTELSPDTTKENLPQCGVKLFDIFETKMCTLCGKSFSTAKRARKHYYNAHSVYISSDQGAAKPNSEKSNEAVHETEKIYECPLCPRLFKFSYSRARHLRECVTDAVLGKGKVGGRYPCPLCSTTFASGSNRRRHIKMSCTRKCLNDLLLKEKAKLKQLKQKKAKQPKWDIKPKETEQKTELKGNEEGQQAPSATIKCNHCPAVFRYASGKYRHMKKHKLLNLQNSVSTTSEVENISSTASDESSQLPNQNANLSSSCHFCGEDFSSSEQMKRHECSHKGESPYRNLGKVKGINRRFHLKDRKKNHKRLIQCTSCKTILPTIGELIKHRASHTERGFLQCPECPSQCQFPAYLLRHMEVHKKQENQNSQSEEQPQSIPQQLLESEEKLSATQSTHKCSLCNETFDDVHVLRKHHLSHISQSDQCPFCKKNYLSRKHVVRHMAMHMRDIPFNCTNCGQQFNHYCALKLHSETCLPAPTKNVAAMVPVVSVMPNIKIMGSLKCSLCPRTFGKRNRLTAHHAAHNSNTLSLCLNCGQYYGCTKLKRHQKDCGVPTAPNCDIVSDEPSQSSSQMKCSAHKTPTTEAPAPTENVSTLKPRRKRKLPFQCSHCPRKFENKHVLAHHHKAHKKKSVSPCPKCGKCFSYRKFNKHSTECTFPTKLNTDPPIESLSAPANDVATVEPATKMTEPQKCSFCPRTFHRGDRFTSHLQGHKKNTLLCCSKCGQCFGSKKLSQHRRKCRVGKEAQTDKPTDNLPTETKNVATTEPNIEVVGPHKCSYCPRTFKNRDGLAGHYKGHKRDTLLPCSNCGQYFEYRKWRFHQRACSEPTELNMDTPSENVSQSPPQTNTESVAAHDESVATMESYKITPPCKCLYCPRTFKKKEGRASHHKAHERNSLLPCSTCGQYFGYKEFFHHQMDCRTAVGLNTDTPIESVSQRPSKTKFSVPVKSNTKPQNFKCPHCPLNFRFNSILLRHIFSHTGVHPYECMLCGKSFRARNVYKQHLTLCDKVVLEEDKSDAAANVQGMPPLEETEDSQAEGQTELKCRFCTKTFTEPRSLRHHILTHNEAKPYRCKACDSCFSRYDHLKIHRTRCNGEKRRLEIRIPKISLDDVGTGWLSKFGFEPVEMQETFDCEVCSKSFLTHSILARHNTMFHVAKLFKCERCDSSFAHERSLRKHKKNKSCTRILKRKTSSSPLEDKPPTETVMEPLHVVKNRILQKIKPSFNKHVCKYCPRAFAHSWTLAAHTRLHTGERPFSCEHCGEGFIRPDYVKRHLIKCPKMKQLPKVLCDKCGGFFLSDLLDDHKSKCIVKPGAANETSHQTEQSASQSTPKGFSCAHCSSRFLLFSQLQEHFLNAHKLETVVTPAESLQHHLSKIPQIKEEPLEKQCDQQLNDNANLSCKLDVALDNELVCPHCNMTFVNKAGLVGHLRVHSTDHPFSCKTCNKGFWSKHLLRNHYRKCNLGLTKETSSSQQLEAPLKAQIDFALEESVLLFKESSTETGSGVLQTSFSCKDELTETSPPDTKVNQEQSKYQCSECDMSFTDGLLLISHLEDHGRKEQAKKLTTCSKCGRECTTQSNLVRHMKIHGINHKFQCPVCAKEFNTPTELEIHQTRHDPSMPYPCKLCDERFLTRPSLYTHYREEHPADVFACHFCDTAYSNKKSLSRHYKEAHQMKQKDVLCALKKKGVVEQSSVTTADENDEGENNSEDSDSDTAPYFPCHVCGKTFPTSESLEDHQRCHLGEKPHECGECGKCFFLASQLQQHQRMHTSEFQCQTCGRGFVTLFALRNHKHTHGKSRPYRCSKCDLGFTGQAHLAEHMTTHQEESFPCDVCNKVFRSKSSRAEHRKSHTKSEDFSAVSFSRADHKTRPPPPESSPVISQELKYRCGVCKNRFKDPEDLSEHGCMAATERPFVCSDCDVHFLHASHLKKHRNTCHPSYSRIEYPCNLCNSSFSSPQHFLGHLKSHISGSVESKHTTEGRNKEKTQEFMCPVCHLCFSSSIELIGHFPTHLDSIFECKVCRMTFPSRQKLEEHEHSHLTSTTEFECTECGQRFLGRDAFRQHDCSRKRHDASAQSQKGAAPGEDEVDVTGEDLFNCTHCSLQFPSKSQFLEHQNKVHVPNKPFPCKHCGKTFALRQYLRRHEKRHHSATQEATGTDRTPIRCVQCRAEFSTVHDLTLHMRVHAEDQVGEFRCDMCYKSFDRWSLLKRHQESHVGEVVYECTECDKAFAFPHLLEEHQQTHASSSQS